MKHGLLRGGLAQKAFRSIRHGASTSAARMRDQRHSTFAPAAPDQPLRRIVSPIPVQELARYRDRICFLAENCMEHRFNLLGSGWQQVRYGMNCPGLEGNLFPPAEPVGADETGNWLCTRVSGANLSECRRIWRLVGADYIPIDWHLDFKSGCRWPETLWYREVRYGSVAGADVKVPWELSRMQHLPQLAWAYALAASGDGAGPVPAIYLREFENQVLDFIALNPPRFGVNWTCTMDVAIRISNWLITYDLFRAYRAPISEQFDLVFRRSVLEHAEHIAANLEWWDAVRSNHYYADITGLLLCSAYLQRTRNTDAWLALAVQELIRETELQFHSDGSNFEGSTCYHRLSAEMCAYATAFILALPAEKLSALREYDCTALPISRPRLTDEVRARALARPAEASCLLPQWFDQRLRSMAEFTRSVTKPDGTVAQIGDNDSGRFLKLMPDLVPEPAPATRIASCGRTVAVEFGDLNHAHLIAAINAFFPTNGPAGIPENSSLDATLIRSLIGTFRFPDRAGSSCRVSRDGAYDGSPMLPEVPIHREGTCVRRVIPLPGHVDLKEIRLAAYPDFGVYIFSSDRLFLSVRCGRFQERGFGGH
ncbi:MAG TPA: heparinase II/III family protein, partial [Chthonomonadales bacterium]|nr:heparinase II/III family protein [Chthonomonadales bacterium]